MRLRTIDKALRSVAAIEGSTVETAFEGGRWWCAIHCPTRQQYLGTRPEDATAIGWGEGLSLAAAVRAALWRLYWRSFGAEPQGAELNTTEAAELVWLLSPGRE